MSTCQAPHQRRYNDKTHGIADIRAFHERLTEKDLLFREWYVSAVHERLQVAHKLKVDEHVRRENRLRQKFPEECASTGLRKDYTEAMRTHDL